MTSPLFLSIFAFGAGRQGNWNNFFRLPALLPLLEYVPQISRQHIPTALSFPSLSLSQPLPLALAFFLPRSHLPLSMPTIAAHHHRFELALLLLLFAIYFIFDLSDFAWRLGNMLLATFMSSLSFSLSCCERNLSNLQLCGCICVSASGKYLRVSFCCCCCCRAAIKNI